MIRKSIIQKSIFCLLALLLSMPISFSKEIDIAKKKLNKTSVKLIIDTLGYKVYSSSGRDFCIVKDTAVVGYSKSSYISKSLTRHLFYPQKKGSLMPKPIYATIEPLLSDIKYNQIQPYNNALPLVDGKECFVGCVPVSVAQVLKYYNYPPYTIADIPSFKTKTVGLAMDSIPKLTRLDWQNIAPCYDNETSKVKKDAIANLMKIICTSCYTDLNVDASPSCRNNAHKALVDYFAFDKDKLHVIQSNHYSMSQFEDLVYKELSKKRPVLVTSNNHAFVCDGYENGLFHANFGWGGSLNGYFDMYMLAPDRDNREPMSVTMGVVPIIGETEIPLSTNLWISTFADPEFPDSLPSNGEVRGSIFCSVHSNTYKEVKSYVSAGYSDGNGKWVLIGDNFSYTTKFGYGIGNGIAVNCVLKDNTTYRIVPLEKCDGKDWEPMENSYYTYFDLVIENGKIKVCPPVQYNVKANASFVGKEDGMYVQLDLSNSGYDDSRDTFYVKLNDKTEYVAMADVIIPANNSITEYCKYADSLDANCIVRVFDSKNNLLAESSVTPKEPEVHMDDTISQDTVAQDSIAGEISEVSAPKDPETISSTLIALGVILAFLLIIFIKIFS